ncbi:MAG: hypothetical protein ABH859_00215 [Pseudomonadota bacterium]
MRSAFIYCLVVLILFTQLMGCARTTKYSRSLSKSTQKGQLYNLQTWNADVIWYATFFSDKFRREYAKEFAQLNHLGPVESARWMAKQAELQDKYWEFYLTIYTKKDFKEFSMNPESFWQIDLTTKGGATVEPTSIEQVSYKAADQIMFPHLNRWSRSYRVCFPKIALGEEVVLNLKSMVGKSTLSWKVK